VFKDIKTQEWWGLFCEDKELYFDIRKDNSINVFYFGGTLARLKYKNGFVAKINKNYYLKNEDNGKGGYTELRLNELNMEEIKDIINEIKTNIKKNFTRRMQIKRKMLIEDPKYIDLEFAFNNVAKPLRFDVVELLDGKLSLVEFEREPFSIRQREIYDQYREFIKNYGDKILDYYKKIIQIKNDLFKKDYQLDFELDNYPGLLWAEMYLIFNDPETPEYVHRSKKKTGRRIT